MGARGPSESGELLREQPEQRQQPWHKTAWVWTRRCGPEGVWAHGEEAVWESEVASEEATVA